MADKQTAQATLLKFAQTYDELIGSEETLVLLQFLTGFAERNATTVLELTEEVKKNPDAFLDMVTPESIMKFKAIIAAAKSGGIGAIMAALA